MGESVIILAYLILLSFAIHLLSTKVKCKPWTSFLRNKLQAVEFITRVQTDQESIDSVSIDFGNLSRKKPSAVFCPAAVDDIVKFIKLAYVLPFPVCIAARGRGHSVDGQAQAPRGVVVDMMSLRSKRVENGGVKISQIPNSSGFYADVGGEQLWIDVLKESIKHGLAPVSWTDYLHLSVGGTLCNAGISGQTFKYGPQISNVSELDVVTGRGELVTCSPDKNFDLFYGVLGGLGQFGIITRARIPLHTAPKRVKWVRMLYSDFSAFTTDQEQLISIKGKCKKNGIIDYLEGSLLLDQNSPNNWKSSFFHCHDFPRILSQLKQHGIIYCLELAIYYDDITKHKVHKELERTCLNLKFMRKFMFQKDVSYVEFLDRVRSGELYLQSKGLWNVPHPWLNIFVPKSRIADFNSGVFRNIVFKRNITTGPLLIYPMNRNKWDDRTSAVIPDEEIFYAVGFLHSSGFNDWQIFDDQNKQVLNFCSRSGIKIKSYFPHYANKEEWTSHFGAKWITFQRRKSMFDPKKMLSPGQGIFD